MMCPLCREGKHPRIVIGDGPKAVHNMEGLFFIDCLDDTLDLREWRLARRDMEDKLRDQIMNGGDC